MGDVAEMEPEMVSSSCNGGVYCRGLCVCLRWQGGSMARRDLGTSRGGLVKAKFTGRQWCLDSVFWYDDRLV